MKHQNAIAVLEDLAKLLSKHGPAAFEELADLLASPEFSSSLLGILRETARRGRTAGVKKRTSRKRGGRDKSPFRGLKASDPRKHSALQVLGEKLMDRQILFRVRDVQAFAESLGLATNPARSRQDVVRVFLEKISTEPLVRIERIIGQLEAEHGESTLSGWTDIILPQKEE